MEGRGSPARAVASWSSGAAVTADEGARPRARQEVGDVRGIALAHRHAQRGHRRSSPAHSRARPRLEEEREGLPSRRLAAWWSAVHPARKPPGSAASGRTPASSRSPATSTSSRAARWSSSAGQRHEALLQGLPGARGVGGRERGREERRGRGPSRGSCGPRQAARRTEGPSRFRRRARRALETGPAAPGADLRRVLPVVVGPFWIDDPRGGRVRREARVGDRGAAARKSRCEAVRAARAGPRSVTPRRRDHVAGVDRRPDRRSSPRPGRASRRGRCARAQGSSRAASP